MDDDETTIYVNGEKFKMTSLEFNLLNGLVMHANKAVSRDELLKEVWGYLSPGDTRTVDVHIQRLRKKLGYQAIDTIYRFGYRLNAVLM